MKPLHLFLAASALASCLCAGAAGRNIHLSPGGDDRNDGSAGHPLRTVEAAVSLAQKAADADSVRIILHDGAYYLEHEILLKGMKRVRIEAAPGEHPVIRGDATVSRWRPLGRKDGKGRIGDGVRRKLLKARLRDAGVTDPGGYILRDNRIDLYCGGERQQLARWPDEGFLRSGEALGPTPKSPFGTEEGIFAYEEDRISTWTCEPDICLFGYFYWDWRDSYQVLASIDTEHKTASLQEPCGGIKSGFRFYGVNLLCELDSPGEYYIDRNDGTVYWYPPESYDGTQEVTVSRFPGKYMIRIDGCEDVTMTGIDLKGGRDNALRISNSRNVLLKDVGAAMFGGDALQIASSRKVSVEGCTFETLGHSGIKASGGNRKTLERADYTVFNTLIRDFSLYQHTYEPAVVFDGCGLDILHCEFYGSYSSAMRINGSDVLIEYNYLHDLVKESDDQGGLDMWWNFGYRGVVIRYNLWENILGGSIHGAAGVRFDDMISGQTVYGNIFNNVGSIHFGGVQIHGGKDNVVDNNVFYRCLAAVSLSPWGSDRWKAAINGEDVQKQLHEQVEIDSELYRTRFPELKEDPAGHADRNFIRNNLAVGCRQFFISEHGQNVKENNNAISMGENPQVEPLEHYLEPAFLATYGMKPIPYKEIGRLSR